MQRHGAAREVRAGGARRDREAVLLGEAQHARDLVAIARQHDRLGPRALQRRGVRRVGDEVVLARQHVLRPDQVAQARRGGAALPRGYHRALMAGGWRIEGYGRSVRGAELRVHLPPRAAPSARRRAARRGARDGAARARHPRSRRGRRGDLRDRALREPGRRRRRRRARTRAASISTATSRPRAGARARRRATRPGSIPPSACPANRTNVSSTGAAPLSEPESAALAALIERLEPVARARSARAAGARADDAARARRRSRASSPRRQGWSSPTSSARPCPVRCATGSATTACRASPTRSSTPACRRSTRATCPGWSRSRARGHANARSVARLIATVSSMRSA